MAKILVVDDDRNVIEILEFVLKKDGHSVVSAGDGRAGLEAALNESPDLIILDVMMPQIDGYSLTGMLREDPKTRNTPVVILTAKGRMRDAFEQSPNVRLYVEKPFEPDELAKSIRPFLP
jgi:CheY-like chemotaxis protein